MKATWRRAKGIPGSKKAQYGHRFGIGHRRRARRICDVEGQGDLVVVGIVGVIDVERQSSAIQVVPICHDLVVLAQVGKVR